MFRQFCAQEPIFVIIDVRSGVEGIPTTTYIAKEELENNNFSKYEDNEEKSKEIQRVFKHIPCLIQAEEAEEVGVEHLLRDINDPSTSVLAMQIKQKVDSLQALIGRLTEIRAYLCNVIDGKMPINNQISYNLQNILNLLPNLNVEELVKSMLVKTNDIHLVMYVSALVRSILALHDLLNNKIKYKDMDEILDRDAGMEVNNGKKESAKEKDPSSPTKTPKTPETN